MQENSGGDNDRAKRLQGESFPMNGDFEISDDESDVENQAQEVNDTQRPIEKRVGVE